MYRVLLAFAAGPAIWFFSMPYPICGHVIGYPCWYDGSYLSAIVPPLLFWALVLLPLSSSKRRWWVWAPLALLAAVLAWNASQLSFFYFPPLLPRGAPLDTALELFAVPLFVSGVLGAIIVAVMMPSVLGLRQSFRFALSVVVAGLIGGAAFVLAVSNNPFLDTLAETLVNVPLLVSDGSFAIAVSKVTSSSAQLALAFVVWNVAMSCALNYGARWLRPRVQRQVDRGAKQATDLFEYESAKQRLEQRAPN